MVLFICIYPSSQIVIARDMPPISSRDFLMPVGAFTMAIVLGTSP